MAISILQGSHSAHQPWHDLISIFWVLLFTELTCTDEDLAKFESIASYTSGVPETDSPLNLACLKQSIVTMDWRCWMGRNRERVLKKTSLSVIRLLHQLRIPTRNTSLWQVTPKSLLTPKSRSAMIRAMRRQGLHCGKKTLECRRHSSQSPLVLTSFIYRVYGCYGRMNLVFFR